MGGSERECLRMINSLFAMVMTFIQVSISWCMQLDSPPPKKKAEIASIILLSKIDLLSGSMAYFVGGRRGWL